MLLAVRLDTNEYYRIYQSVHSNGLLRYLADILLPHMLIHIHY